MKDIRMILPNMASDTAGAASMLFALEGLTVIHDAAGSMESFITFDEARDLEGRHVVASRLSRLEAITGDDGILLEKLERECEGDRPPFVAVLGSPVPFTIGTDLEGIAEEARWRTGVPAFGVNSGGFATYDKGGAEALKKVIAATVQPRPTRKGVVNLLGAWPMDYSTAELEGIRQNVLASGAKLVRTLTCARGMEEMYLAAEAEHNLVISLAGLSAARYMEQAFGIPYTVGVPIAGAADWPEGAAGRRVLVLGEAVLTKGLVQNMVQAGITAVAGITTRDDPQIFPDVPALVLDTEEKLCRELAKPYDLIVGDPLYRLLMPRDPKAKFVERPHRALSGRLYPPTEENLEQLTIKMKEGLL